VTSQPIGTITTRAANYADRAELEVGETKPKWLRFADPKPVRLTNNPVEFYVPTPAWTAKRSLL
jgi:hypothetical protein